MTSSTQPTQLTEKISSKEKIGYGMGDAASHIVFDSCVAILAYFYTDIYGLSPAIMGTIFLAVRLLDAFTDPIMGAIADNTVTRWGRFRPYLLIISIPFAVSTILVYTVPDYGETGKIIFAVATYVFMTLMYTAINIPYCSLGAVITADPKENMSLQSYRFAIAPIGGALGTAAILPLADYLSPGDRAAGIQMAMAIFGVLGCLMFLFCFSFTKERVQPLSEENMDIIRDLKLLVKNDQWRILAVYNFTMLVSLVIRAGMILYYVTYILNKDTDIASYFLLGTTIFSMLGSLIAKPFSDHFCKIQLSIWNNILLGLAGLLFFVIPGDNWIVALCLYLFLQTLQGANGPLQWSMITDANNYGEWKTGRRITGMNIAANIFTIKLGVAVGGALIGWGLAWFGFQSAVDGKPIQQTQETLNGILIIFTVFPAILYLITGLYLKFKRYDLTEGKVKNIIHDLEHGRFSNKVNEPVPPVPK
ncbi:MFS transporter [Prodigiosinella confusarubida]|uniref:MFS transporter n=1 Tax=Serratia sp. (strain ATCC 39006) TaxID=104623 RepID=A0A2I5TNY9_SERS3|nr:glycoside-pentoside-hexuronide (GPH):cation symporter [Serratia sp. ATCC 39006]AUH01959.1 MFS transporter [Serratia sp. ATCC 39006]AUH06281.1 MFS transporter [Serratia sp. ATCC 39006]